MATSRQKTAIAKIVENGGNVSKAMRESGYSEATAKTPQKLTNSQAFQELMAKMGVTDERLVEVIKGGLGAERLVISGNGEDSVVDMQPDHPTRHKFLETSLRLKGLNKVEDTGNTFNFVQVTNVDKDQYAL